MAAIQIPEEIDHQFEELATRMGESTNDLVRKALLSYLEDRQDAFRAADRLKNVTTRINLDEIGRKYGLVD